MSFRSANGRPRQRKVKIVKSRLFCMKKKFGKILTAAAVVLASAVVSADEIAEKFPVAENKRE